MTVLFTDAFTNTNGTAIATHDADYAANSGGAEIQSNAVQGNGSDSVIHWSGASLPDDQYVQADIAQVGTSGAFDNYLGLLLRVAADSTTWYEADFLPFSGGLKLWRVASSGASYTDIGGSYSFLVTQAAGAVLYFEIQGSSLDAKVNGTSYATATDATYSSGPGAGIAFDSFSGTAGRLDDLEIGNFLTTLEGTGAVGLPPLGVAGAGAEARTGTGSVNLGPLGASGAGAETRTGTGAVNLPALGVTGTGEVTAVLTGTGAVSLPALGVAGEGTADAAPAPAPAPAAFTGSPAGRRIPVVYATYKGLRFIGTALDVKMQIEAQAREDARRRPGQSSRRKARAAAFKAAQAMRESLFVQDVGMPGVLPGGADRVAQVMARELQRAYQHAYTGALATDARIVGEQLASSRVRPPQRPRPTAGQMMVEQNNQAAIAAAMRLFNGD